MCEILFDLRIYKNCSCPVDTSHAVGQDSLKQDTAFHNALHAKEMHQTGDCVR
jgi:hypothetical protein